MVKLKSSLRVPSVVTTFPFHFHEYGLPNKTIYRLCDSMSNTTGPTCRVGSAYPSGAPEISFVWGSNCGCTLICDICTYCVCLFSSQIVVNIMEFDATVIPVRGLASFKTRFNQPFSTWENACSKSGI